MEPMYYSAPGMLDALTALLRRSGHNADMIDIILGMNAPWMLVHENGAYIAGAGLFQPQWLNLYLQPHGLCMRQATLPSADIPCRLRTMENAILPLQLGKERPRLQLFTGYAQGRYHFQAIRPDGSHEELSLSLPMLRRRLPEAVRLCTVEACEPKPVDFIPLLLTTLENIRAYQADLLAAWERTITRGDLRQMRDPLFRALMHDLRPMTFLTGDSILADELELLEHDFRHIFTANDPERQPLSLRLPKGSIKRCLLWMYEDVLDRLYQLGVDETLLEPYLTLRR